MRHTTHKQRHRTSYCVLYFDFTLKLDSPKTRIMFGVNAAYQHIRTPQDLGAGFKKQNPYNTPTSHLSLFVVNVFATISCLGYSRLIRPRIKYAWTPWLYGLNKRTVCDLDISCGPRPFFNCNCNKTFFSPFPHYCQYLYSQAAVQHPLPDYRNWGKKSG